MDTPRLQKIKQLAQVYSLKSYQINSVLYLEQQLGFEGKEVLEVGGSLPKEFVLDALGVKRWIAIEYLPYYSDAGFDYPGGKVNLTLEEVRDQSNLGAYQVISGKIEDLSHPFFLNFDIVFSVAALQHIHAVPQAFNKIYHALKLGGYYYSLAAPIWSCHNGHLHLSKHSASGEKYDYSTNSPIPPWGHLLMRPPELYEFLCQVTDFETAASLIYDVYNSSRINRFFLEDYLHFLKMSPFSQGQFNPMPKVSVPSETQTQLETRYPGYHEFASPGFQFLLARDRE